MQTLTLFDVRICGSSETRIRVVGADRPGGRLPVAQFHRDPFDGITSRQAMADGISDPGVVGLGHAYLIAAPTPGQAHERAQTTYAGSVVDHGAIRTGFTVRRVTDAPDDRKQKQSTITARKLRRRGTARYGLPFVANDATVAPVPGPAVDREWAGTPGDRSGLLTMDNRGRAVRFLPVPFDGPGDRYAPVPDVDGPLHAVTVGQWSADTGSLAWTFTDLSDASTLAVCLCNTMPDFTARWRHHRAAGITGGRRRNGKHVHYAYSAGKRTGKGRTRAATEARKRASAVRKQEERDTVVIAWIRAMSAGPARPGRTPACKRCGECDRCIRAARAWQKRQDERAAEAHGGIIATADGTVTPADRAHGVRAIATG